MVVAVEASFVHCLPFELLLLRLLLAVVAVAAGG